MAAGKGLWLALTESSIVRLYSSTQYLMPTLAVTQLARALRKNGRIAYPFLVPSTCGRSV